MNKHIYTYTEQRFTKAFLDSWGFYDYNSYVEIEMLVDGVSHKMKGLMFLNVEDGTELDDDFFRALKLYGDKEGWSGMDKENLVIVGNATNTEPTGHPIQLRDGRGWSDVLHLGSEFANRHGLKKVTV